VEKKQGKIRKGDPGKRKKVENGITGLNQGRSALPRKVERDDVCNISGGKDGKKKTKGGRDEVSRRRKKNGGCARTLGHSIQPHGPLPDHHFPSHVKTRWGEGINGRTGKEKGGNFLSDKGMKRAH